MVTLATLAELESRLERVETEHIRTWRVTVTLFRVVCVSSRRYKHPHRDPRRRKGLLHTKRTWHFVTCLRLSDGIIRYSCNGPHCCFLVDGHGSTICKHSLAVCKRLLRNPQEASEIMIVETVGIVDA